MEDDIFNILIGLMTLGLFILIIIGSVSAYQAFQDSQICKQQTGLYGGCELKQRESTYHVDVRK